MKEIELKHSGYRLLQATRTSKCRCLESHGDPNYLFGFQSPRDDHKEMGCLNLVLIRSKSHWISSNIESFLGMKWNTDLKVELKWQP